MFTMRTHQIILLTAIIASAQMAMLSRASAKSIFGKGADIYTDKSWLFFTTRDNDGDSGDGTCDPCDTSCRINEIGGSTSSKRFSESESEPLKIRTLYCNASATEPWLKGEVARWNVIEGRADTLQFNCDDIPNVCQNMCYGAYCKGFGTTLTVGRTTAKCQNARKKNSCGSVNPNRCSIKFQPAAAPGNSCDEYPFASTLEGQQAAQDQASTRSVPAGENSSQGGFISGFYRKGLADGTQFEVTFTYNVAATGYCQGAPTPDCTPDPTDNQR